MTNSELLTKADLEVTFKELKQSFRNWIVGVDIVTCLLLFIALKVFH